MYNSITNIVAIMQRRIALSIDPKLLAKIDEVRGDVPRSKFFARAAKQELANFGCVAPGKESALATQLERA